MWCFHQLWELQSIKIWNADYFSSMPTLLILLIYILDCPQSNLDAGAKELLQNISEKQGRKMDSVKSAKDIPKFVDMFKAWWTRDINAIILLIHHVFSLSIFWPLEFEFFYNMVYAYNMYVLLILCTLKSTMMHVINREWFCVILQGENTRIYTTKISK